ncbi:protein FEZ-like [Gossypium arboreum]|uniref:NAC domain-containing protein n=1 Tax=Gossypium arboreum TaxID=29729 RepID=A0ABR0MSZ8_GOSAR|nr:protein FEZ-like [Gossypium arboreum]KAK5777103.1 hypothetical protein PVK06_045069 [Gossypium arboreum]
MEDQVDGNEDYGDKLPVGFRFLPTDVELVTHYLINKVIYNPFSSFIFQEINATELYTKSPKNSVQFCNGEREWFFFIYMDMNIDNMHNKAIEKGGDELGFWQSIGDRKCVKDTNGNILATKITFIYFSGSPSHRKKTHWRIDEFRLPIQFYTLHNSKEKWAAGRLTRGRDYTSF